MPRVFVSATTAQLGPYRRDVRDKLLELAVEPVLQDHFPPDYRTVVDMLRDRIRNCDAVICLVGHAYGSEPRERADDKPRRSYTQLEYEIAAALDKPTFLFFAEVADAPGEPSELTELQNDYIARLKASDHLWSAFDSHEKLRELVGVLRFDAESLKGVVPRQTVVWAAELVDMAGQLKRVGEENWPLAVARPYHELLDNVLHTFRGELREQTADWCLATFDSISHAVSAALALHQRVAGRKWEVEPPGVRVAVHQGQLAQFPGVDKKQVLLVGRARNVCRELARVAASGQTLLTGVTFDEARVRASDLSLETGLPVSDLRWESHGRYLLAGDEPLEVREVGVIGRSPLTPPLNSPFARRADSAEEEKMRGWRPSVGQPVPRTTAWIITEKLGQGGFGEAWLAEHRSLGARHVFKFCFDVERLQSFKRELALFKLIQRHLGERDDIARLYGVNVEEPPYYLESEYAANGDLAKWVERQEGLGRIPLNSRLALLAKVGRTVAAAHSLGIIHKDLKPSNVFIVERDGQPYPRLADFGIGCLADRSLMQDMTDSELFRSLVGRNDSSRTPLYSPPEAQTGAPATTAGDIYALGVMLYQFVVGDLRRPFGVGFEEQIDDELLRKDIVACTHQDPERRLSGAAQFAERLEKLDERRRRVAAARRRRLLNAALLVMSLLSAVTLAWMYQRAGSYSMYYLSADASSLERALDHPPWLSWRITAIFKDLVLKDGEKRHEVREQSVARASLWLLRHNVGGKESSLVRGQLKNYVLNPNHVLEFDELAVVARQLAQSGDRERLLLDLAAAAKDTSNAQRQTNALRALFVLKEPSQVLRHSKNPTQRTELLHRLNSFGIKAELILTNLGKDLGGGATPVSGPTSASSEPLPATDQTLFDATASTRRALLLALGEYRFDLHTRQTLGDHVVQLYRTDRDSGIHGACAWLLRQWGRAKDVCDCDNALKQEDAELQRDWRCNNLHRDWFVNSQGQTFAIVRGPVRFGRARAPNSRVEATPEGISHSFAIGLSEVTQEHFDQFLLGHRAPRRTTPAAALSWHQAAQYCNWLTLREGSASDCCYDKDKNGHFTETKNFLMRTGYRLPVEAEWEYSCRAGATTAYACGNDDQYLSRYASVARTATDVLYKDTYLKMIDQMLRVLSMHEDHRLRAIESIMDPTWGPVRVGHFKPNDLGLFDMHGSLWEWCSNSAHHNGRHALRGGAFLHAAADAACDRSYSNYSSARSPTYGFRLARTLPIQ